MFKGKWPLVCAIAGLVPLLLEIFLLIYATVEIFLGKLDEATISLILVILLTLRRIK